MKPKNLRIIVLLTTGWALLLALGIYALPGLAGQIVSGVYKVTQTAELGMQMRVTMQIRLTNASEDRILVTQARLRGFLHAGRGEDKTAQVTLEPHSSAEFTQEFTIAKQEFDQWRKGAQPHLGLKMRVAGAAETEVTIPLMRLPESR